ncbi:MAG: hypothetical protein L6R30_25620 [Thermoanaerobaculia bacterium]|nr:hypothetical protein [Thermoanaerobaculia bacterium]
MPAPGSCRICSRPDCKSLDARILAGEAINAVARQIGLPKSSLRCHWDRCRRRGRSFMPRPASGGVGTPSPAPVPVSPPAPAVGSGKEESPHPDALAMPRAPELPPDDDQALRELKAIHGVALKEYRAAYDAGDRRTMALFLPQLRQNIELRASIVDRSRKEDKTPAERLMENADFTAASRVLMETLDGFPEARAAVRKALARYLEEA